jgi:hypothetical protein
MQFKYDIRFKLFFSLFKKLLNVSKLFENDIFMEKIQYTFNNNTMQHFFGP